MNVLLNLSTLSLENSIQLSAAALYAFHRNQKSAGYILKVAIFIDSKVKIIIIDISII